MFQLMRVDLLLPTGKNDGAYVRCIDEDWWFEEVWAVGICSGYSVLAIVGIFERMGFDFGSHSSHGSRGSHVSMGVTNNIEGMRNGANNSLSRRTERSSFIPNSLRAISSYLRNVSAATVASTVRSAGASVSSSIFSPEDNENREQVHWAGFDKLELGIGIVRRVLLLAYINGFHVWDVEEADDVRELVSKRDGPVALLQMQPRLIASEAAESGFKEASPLLLVVTGDGTVSEANIHGGFGLGYSGGDDSPSQSGSSNFVPTVVRFYSLRTHTYVHALRFRSAIYAVRCSARIVAVALATQIHCFDAATLQNTISVLTYPIPQGVQGSGIVNRGYGPMTVGPRWLAYAANQALVSNTGRVSPQHFTHSPGISPSTSPMNGSVMAHYAKESSKQIAAGIVTLGDMGYKTLTRYCSELLPDGASSPGPGSSSWKNSSNALAGRAYEPEYAGTVVVRDFVSKAVVAQFRAHTSPLSGLCFDPSGTLLVTASVYGHNVNVFRIMPSPLGNGSGSASFDVNASHVHLYKLCRGVTNAVIQDISFSNDSHWIAISSSRGTTHLFAVSPFGGVVGPHTHGGAYADGSMGSSFGPVSTVPWWSSTGPVKFDQLVLPPPPPPITLSVVCKIKNGNDGWRSTLTGAAAAATGRTNIPSGAVAVVFHNGGGHILESHLGNSNLKDQLWVFFPSGHVIRYALCPYAGTDTVHCSNSPEIGAGSYAPSETDWRMIVEPLQKWDIRRKSNWLEREENIDSLGGIGSEEKGTGALAGYRNTIILAHSGGSERLEKEEIITEEKHRWYLSNAEVHAHQARPPIWAKSEIYFHVIMSETTSEECSNKVRIDAEFEIEKFPTRAVEVRKKDLIPVFEHLQNQVKVARNSLSESLKGTSALKIHQLKARCMQNGLAPFDAGCAQLQCSISGNSLVSEGSNSGSPEQMKALYYSNSQTAFGHHIQGLTSAEREEILSSSRNLNISNHQSNGRFTPQMANCITTGPPPVDIPRSNEGDAGSVQVVENFLSLDDNSKILPMRNYSSGEQTSIKRDVGAGLGVISEGHVVGGLVSQAALPENQSSSSDDSDLSVPHPWDGTAEDETVSPSSVLQGTNISKQCLHEIHTLQGNIRLHLQDEYVNVEDAKDTISHNKGGIPEGEKSEDDAWEGGMFQFCDEE